MKSKNIIIYLPGYGLGDLYNFGFYILPKIIASFSRIYLVAEIRENIFLYQKNVRWVYLEKQSNLKSSLEEILNGEQISEIIYPDNHPKTTKLLRSVAKINNIQLVAPDRKYIDDLINSEKTFYFNVNVNIFKKILKSRFYKNPKTNIKFFGKQEITTLNKYVNVHRIRLKKLNIGIFPDSNKNIKRLTRSNVLKLVNFFNLGNLVNIFIVLEKRRRKLYRMPKFANLCTLDSFYCREIFYLISQLDICVTVDTGFLHIANHLNKKVIGLFGPTDGNLSVMNKNILEIDNLVQNHRCLFYDRIVYKNPCLRNDFCIHNSNQTTRKSFKVYKKTV